MSQATGSEEARTSSDGLRNLDEAMQSYIDQGKVAGLATLIARHGQIIHQGCYGKLSLATGNPVERNSLFRLFSLTKPVTAVAALILHEKGHFDLHDPISKWIPEFQNLKVLKRIENTTFAHADLEREPTLWHLLTHTAGFGYGFEPEDPLADLYREAGFFHPFFGLQVTLPELIRQLALLPLANQPGEVFRYSISYDVLTYIIELMAGEPFDIFLRKQIFEPLKMDDTGLLVTANQRNRLSSLYSHPDQGENLLLEQPPESPSAQTPSVRSGGGGLVSTPLDYFRFLSMLLNGGEMDGVRLLKATTVRQMISPQVAIPFRHGMGYGLGVGVQTEDQGPDGFPQGIFGWDSAGGSEAWADPRTGLIAIIMYQAFAYQEPARRFRSLVWGLF
jgi:CubicO group peptidase (beta-lactamase class C family)